jgi:putative ABC transport system ATP-binding protein
MSPMLDARNLYRFYHAGDDETLALQGVSLAVAAGEVVAVSGPSGSGKSTLLACLAGLEEPDGGTVEVAGERLSRRPEDERARMRGRHIGVLYQEANLVGHLSLEDNVALAQRVGASDTGAEWRRELLDACGVARRAHALPRQLSGGELARGGLAVALAADPGVLLADEPTGELDEDSARRIVGLLHDRADSGTAVLVVTHSDNVAGRADRRLFMRDGRVEE